MPILTVYGIPIETKQDVLEHFAENLRRAVASVGALEIKKEQVSIFFPQDLMPKGLGEEVIVFIDSLTEKPERTVEVKQKLVMNLIGEVHDCFPKTDLVECCIRSHQVTGYGKLQTSGAFIREIY